jgi:hypothetical protein
MCEVGTLEKHLNTWKTNGKGKLGPARWISATHMGSPGHLAIEPELTRNFPHRITSSMTAPSTHATTSCTPNSDRGRVALSYQHAQVSLLFPTVTSSFQIVPAR